MHSRAEKHQSELETISCFEKRNQIFLKLAARTVPIHWLPESVCGLHLPTYKEISKVDRKEVG